MSHRRHKTRDRSHRPSSGSHKTPTNSLADDLHDELQAGLDDIKSSLFQQLTKYFDQKLDQLEQKLDHIEQQSNTIKSEVNRFNERSSNLSTVMQSQRDIERSIAQVIEAIRSFQMMMVLSGAKNASEIMKHDLLTSLAPAPNSKDTSTPNLLGS